nr:RNA-directed DNA polymerase, eukaryota, reverse transcriptase zinc-binding domain protein [Tanacetum cinerariifolium]
GELMSRRSAWDDTVNKIRSRLSNWKVKTLSIEGRLTLLKSVLDASPLYYMSIFKTPKGVLKEVEAIKRVGDGLSTRFWLDIWVSKLPLSERFPRLFMLDVEKEVSVAAKLGFVSIDVSFRRGVRDGVERQQWDDLQSLMQSVFLSSPGDRWICDLSGDEEYRVK